MVHVALLLLMLEAAANANLVSTIGQKRNTPFLQLSTSGPADYPIFRRKRPWRPHSQDRDEMLREQGEAHPRASAGRPVIMRFQGRPLFGSSAPFGSSFRARRYRRRPIGALTGSKS
jgi:hypothetical protein